MISFLKTAAVKNIGTALTGSWSVELRNTGAGPVTGLLSDVVATSGATSYTYTVAGSVGVTGIPTGAQTTALAATVVIPANGFVLVSGVSTFPALGAEQLAAVHTNTATFKQTLPTAQPTLESWITHIQGDSDAVVIPRLPNCPINPEEIRRVFFACDWDSPKGQIALDAFQNLGLDFCGLLVAIASGTGGAGSPGPVGPAGPAGLAGAAGAAGATGPAGAAGLAGAAGAAGAVGAVGAVGPAGATGPAGPQVITNTLGGAGGNITSVVNGVPGVMTPPVGIVADTLGFSAAGNIVKQAVPAVVPTTNVLTGTGNALTSTVNGVASAVTPANGGASEYIGFDSSGVLVKTRARTSSRFPGQSLAAGTITLNHLLNLPNPPLSALSIQAYDAAGNQVFLRKVIGSETANTVQVIIPVALTNIELNYFG